MRWRPPYDPRESPRHRPLLETRSTIAYLPYSLRWAIDPAVLAVALIYGLVLGVFSGYLVGLWIVTLFGSGVIAWLLAVQARAVHGFGDPPRLDAQEMVSVGRRALLMLVLVVVATGAFSALRVAWPVAAVPIAWLVGALLPSMFVLLAVEDDFFEAVSPLRILRVLVHSGPIGWALALAAGWSMQSALVFLASLVGQPETVVSLISHTHTSEKVLGPIVFIWVAAWSLHLQGHYLHHRREAAGLGVVLAAATEEELSELRTEQAVRSRLASLRRALEAHDEVLLDRLSAQEPPEGADPLAFHEQLWTELLFHHLAPEAVRVAKPLLAEAVRSKRYALAVEVWIEAKRLSPSFDPGSEVTAKLREMAEAHGDQAMVARL